MTARPRARVTADQVHDDHPFGKPHWDAVAEEALQAAPLEAWRAYMRRVYLRLVQEWFDDVPGYKLKTDLFEEAVSSHHLLQDLGQVSVGIDTSTVVVNAARDRLRGQGASCSFVVGDLRQLPLKSRSVRQILSGSSLDHFASKEEIGQSLRQLADVLSVDGVLIITFDNPHNPVVWVRNHLPFHWLNRLGLIPYYVGATYDRREARAQLEAAELTVTHETVVGHAPRVAAIALVRLAEHFGWQWLEAFVSRWLDRIDAIERWPTRYITGYYLAFRAVRRK